MDTQLQLNKIIQDFENYKIAIDAHSIVAVTDTRGVITHVNEKFCAISQFSYDELIGSTHKIINSGYHPRNFFTDIWKVIANGKIWNGEICNRTKYGELYWVDTTIVPLKNTKGKLQNYISIRTDITKLKKSEDHAHYMAFHDELTGLPNRRYMQEKMQQLIASSYKHDTNSAIIILNLDNFKYINDTFGHDHGDKILKIVAQRLLRCVPEPNSIIRLGGDEFLVILTDLSPEQDQALDTVMKIAEEINTAINTPFYLKKQKIQTSTSSGIFIFQKSEVPENRLLKYADIALYNAKINGKNCICIFDPVMEQSILANTILMTDLHTALARDEFELYYQRIVNADQCIIGYEALLRWRHPEKGLILPDHFINEIEKSGMIHKVGKKVLTMACQQLQRWSHHPERKKWSISVNISVEQFRQSNFDEMILQLINEYNIHPQLLCLELTESMSYKDMQNSIAKMKKLIAQGLSFSMDDFGTGYSSLNYLRLLPLSQLKIDRTFVEHINQNPRDIAIVKTIITLANILNLNVVAEGVETEEQFQLLKENRCTAFQGYYFGHPEAMNT